MISTQPLPLLSCDPYAFSHEPSRSAPTHRFLLTHQVQLQPAGRHHPTTLFTINHTQPSTHLLLTQVSFTFTCLFTGRHHPRVTHAHLGWVGLGRPEMSLKFFNFNFFNQIEPLDLGPRGSLWVGHVAPTDRPS